MKAQLLEQGMPLRVVLGTCMLICYHSVRGPTNEIRMARVLGAHGQG